MKILALLALSASALLGQPLTAPTELVWALDAGVQLMPTPLLRFYLPNGVQRGTVTLLGTGQARGFCFDSSGAIYVCRGDEVRKLSAAGVDLGQIFTAPAGAVAAQDVFVRGPSANPLVVVAFGASSGTSMVALYTSLSGGAPSRVLTNSSLAQPRRVLMPQNGEQDILYVLSRDNNLLFQVNTAAANPTLNLYFDLTPSMLGPVGLAWDAALTRFFVASDFGQLNNVGTVITPSPTFTTSFTYPTIAAPGLRAPGGMAFDRFRRLYVAGRNMNGGTAGVYVFDASVSAPSPPFLARFPASGSPAPVNVVDVELQPTDIAICAPLEVSVPAMANQTANRFVLSSPFYAGYPYVAAFSLNWPTRCAPDLAPGPLAASLTFPLPDVRALPFLDDVFFRGSAGIVAPGDPPPLGGASLLPFFSLMNFAGTLNAAGLAELFITPNLPVSLEGSDFSLAFVVLDPLLASGIGYISQPTCVELRPASSVLTLCP